MTWAPTSFVGRLSAVERSELLTLGVTRTLRQGTRLLVEGARDTHVEVLRRGHVKVTATMAGVPRLVAVRLPGDLIGEFAAITGNGRTATVTAGGDVVSTVIRQADFLPYLATHPRVAGQLTAAVGERLRWANARRSEFVAFPVQVRLAQVLGDIAATCGEPDPEGGVRLGVQLNQTELATLVGAAEDTVQKALRMLRREGLLRTGYRQITVLEPDTMRRLVDEAARP